MQKLKPEIRDNILKNAETLFYAQSYEQASTRDIAEACGMSVSNLYKYFRNKEMIFDGVVREFYKNYLIKMRSFLAHGEPDSFDDAQTDNVAGALFDSIRGNTIKFVILMDKSNGTKYENFRHKIAAEMLYHIMGGVPKAVDDKALKIITENFFRGIVEIAKSRQSDTKMLDSIKQIVAYHMAGMSKIYK